MAHAKLQLITAGLLCFLMGSLFASIEVQELSGPVRVVGMVIWVWMLVANWALLGSVNLFSTWLLTGFLIVLWTFSPLAWSSEFRLAVLLSRLDFLLGRTLKIGVFFSESRYLPIILLLLLVMMLVGSVALSAQALRTARISATSVFRILWQATSLGLVVGVICTKLWIG